MVNYVTCVNGKKFFLSYMSRLIQDLLEGMELGDVRELSCYLFIEWASCLCVDLEKLLQGLSSDSFSQIKPNCRHGRKKIEKVQ